MKTSDIVPISLTRRELYDLVWTAPMAEAAVRLGISRTWLTKICHKAGVPYPSRAYWDLLASGKQPEREKLAGARGRDDVIILRPRGRGGHPHPADGAGGEEAVDLPERLTRLHPVLTGWRAGIWRAQDRLRREPWRKQGQAPVQLDKRRLRILDAFLKALERRGHALDLCAAPPGLLRLLLDGREVELVLRQDQPGPVDPRAGEEPQPAKPWLLSPPAALLSLEVLAWSEPPLRVRWADLPDARLEEQLADIVAAVSELFRGVPPRPSHIRMAQAPTDADDSEEQRWIALRQIAERWDSAESVRRLIGRLRQDLEADGRRPTPAQQAWLDWAQARIRQAEALVEGGLDEVISATAAGGAPAEGAPALAPDQRIGRRD